MKPDHERVTKLLTDTVTLLCKNGLTYDQELKIQGLIAITLDSVDVFVVSINESFGSSGLATTPVSETPATSASSDRLPARKRHAPSEDIVDLTRLVETPDIRPPPRYPPMPSAADQSKRPRPGPQMPQGARGPPSSSQRNAGMVGSGRMPPPGPSNSSRMMPPPCSVMPSRCQAMSLYTQQMSGREDSRPTLNSTITNQIVSVYQNQQMWEENQAAAFRRQQHQQQQQVNRMAVARQQASSSRMSGQHVPLNHFPNYSPSAAPQDNFQPRIIQNSITPSYPSSSSFPFQLPAMLAACDNQNRMVAPMSNQRHQRSLPMLTERPAFPDAPVQQIMEYERNQMNHQMQQQQIQQQQMQQQQMQQQQQRQQQQQQQQMQQGSYMSSNYNQKVYGGPGPGTDLAIRNPNAPGDCGHRFSPATLDYFPIASATSVNPVRRSPRGRVEHIDLCDDAEELLHNVFLQEISPNDISMPASSIVIQPDNLDSNNLDSDNLDSIFNQSTDTEAFLFDSPVSTSSNVCQTSQPLATESNRQPEFIQMANVQEIRPIETNSDSNEEQVEQNGDDQNQSPDLKLRTGLSDSGRSTGSERLDIEEGFTGQLDGSLDETNLQNASEGNDKSMDESELTGDT